MPPTKGWRLGVNHTFMGQPPPLLVAWQREGEGEGSGPLCSDNPPPARYTRRLLTCTKVIYTLSTSGRSSRSTFTLTKSSLSRRPISSFWKDSSSIMWHQ